MRPSAPNRRESSPRPACGVDVVQDGAEQNQQTRPISGVLSSVPAEGPSRTDASDAANTAIEIAPRDAGGVVGANR